jgi:hypothetical protein
MATTWIDRLDQLRREQNPKRYPPSEDRRLPLYLPIPQPPPDWCPTEEEEPDPEPRVIIIDL